MIAGIGAKGDTIIDLGDQHGYWSVSSANTNLTLRMLGISIKHFALDLKYSDMQYPASLPHPVPQVVQR